MDWEVIKGNGVEERVKMSYHHGAILIGISAGAVQLSLMGIHHEQHFETFQLVPFVIDVHDEANGWERLKKLRVKLSDHKAYGIPFVAGLVYHPDGTVEKVGCASKPVISITQGQVCIL